MITTSEYGEVDCQFGEGMIVVVTILLTVSIYWLGMTELICLSVVSTFWLPARHGGPRSTIIVIAGLCGLAFYLLGYVEDAMPLTYSVPWIHYWGYCNGISQPVHHTINYRCPDGHYPLPAETQWYIQTMQNNPTLKTFLVLLPYVLPCIATVLVTYSYFSNLWCRGQIKT